MAQPEDGNGGGGLLSGIISFFRRAGSGPISPAASPQSLSSNILSQSGSPVIPVKKSGRSLTYESWRNDVEGRLERLVTAFATPFDRPQELQPHFKKLLELDDFLAVDVLVWP